MKLFLRNIILCCSIFLLSCDSVPEKGNLFSGEVTRVLSGQTVEVRLTGASEVVKLRIEGIDAPDWRQKPWSTAAKEKLEELVIGKPIAIEADNLKRDRYNRIRGHLWQGRVLVTQQLVEGGYVLVNDRYIQPYYSNLLRSSQEYARLMGYGIWNPQQAMRYTPSQFRSQNTP